MQEIVGTDHVETNIDLTMGAEDFSFMLLEKPGCYAYIANSHGGIVKFAESETARREV
jgi:hippurate hydrolase